jgi:hypothetical protein
VFEKFWKLYPARHGRKLGKALCLKLFVALSPEDQALVLHAAQHYAQASQPKREKIVAKFTKDARYPVLLVQLRGTTLTLELPTCTQVVFVDQSVVEEENAQALRWVPETARVRVAR